MNQYFNFKLFIQNIKLIFQEKKITQNMKDQHINIYEEQLHNFYQDSQSNPAKLYRSLDNDQNFDDRGIIMDDHLQVNQLRKKRQIRKFSKNKNIHKENKSANQKKKKRIRDSTLNISIGRPKIDPLGQEKQHLLIYHFSRFMIFLKLKQVRGQSNHSLRLTNQQNEWMGRAHQIMSIDNFPLFHEKRPIFLLHANSIHFIFQHRLNHQQCDSYDSDEVKFILFAFLQKRKMLSTAIYNYINNYWSDIIFLINNPDGFEQNIQALQNHPPDYNIEVQLMEMHNSEQQQVYNQEDRENQKNIQKPNDALNIQKKYKSISQIQQMKKQLELDDSIIGYQLACYFHACCQKFNLIIQDRK